MVKVLGVCPDRYQLFFDGLQMQDFLKQAVDLGETSANNAADELLVKEVDLKEAFSVEINKILLKENLIDDLQLFRCGLYVARALGGMITEIPQKTCIVDYLTEGMEESKPGVFRKCADFCCMVCTLYDRFGSHGLMDKGYYVLMGEKLYYLYYINSGEDIGSAMSRKFEAITDVARKSIAAL